MSKDWRGQDLGLALIEGLKFLSIRLGTYKTVLSCLEKNVGFYEKCGLQKKEVSMAVYHPENE